MERIYNLLGQQQQFNDIQVDVNQRVAKLISDMSAKIMELEDTISVLNDRLSLKATWHAN